MREFYELWFLLYERRKEYLAGILEAVALKHKIQARFILVKIENKITIENRKTLEMIATLENGGYDSDPVKAWKESQKNIDLDKEESDFEEETTKSGSDYVYLLGMTLWRLTREKKEELLKKRDENIKELEDLKSKTPSDLWWADLETLMQELDAVEKKENSVTTKVRFVFDASACVKGTSSLNACLETVLIRLILSPLYWIVSANFLLQ